ncbi:radical SAM protein [Deltaproteobacteria bacterium TL4]
MAELTTKPLNPKAVLCFYGLYASINASCLKEMGVHLVLGGEFEEPLLRYCLKYQENKTLSSKIPFESHTYLERINFQIPDRHDLPDLSRYAQLILPGSRKKTAYVEASRGCKHQCRHCPIVPVYQKRFFVIPQDVVLADIRQQVASGAEHLTFGDPDFFNGIGHALPIVQALHAEFPTLTYDVTLKIEHLLKHQASLSVLKETGCLLITSAVESFENETLELLQKGHTVEDIRTVVQILRELSITLNPTFIAFTPWTTLANYRHFLTSLVALDLVEHVSPIQLAIRLLVPHQSRLLECQELQHFFEVFDEKQWVYPWKNRDPRMEELQLRLVALIAKNSASKHSRTTIFSQVWNIASEYAEAENPFPPLPNIPQRATVPYLNEPWYC